MAAPDIVARCREQICPQQRGHPPSQVWITRWDRENDQGAARRRQAVIPKIPGLEYVMSGSSDARSARVWLITGATSGFGRALAEAAGDIVVGAVRSPDRLDDLVAAHPSQVSAVRLDVTDTHRCAVVVEEVVARFGRIDVLVNNAGRTQVGALEETTERELRDLFDLHFFGPAALTRAVLPHMRRAGRGAVVQMSSVGGS